MVPRFLRLPVFALMLLLCVPFAEAGTGKPLSPSVRARMDARLAHKVGSAKMHAAADVMGHYIHRQEGFDIQYPGTWDILPATGTNEGSRVVASFAAPKTTSNVFRQNLNVVVEVLPDPTMSLAEYSDATMESLRTIPTLRILSTNATTLAGAPARELRFEVDTGGLTLRVHQVWTVQNGKGYLLTGAAVASSDPKTDFVTDRMMQSFTFIKAS